VDVALDFGRVRGFSRRAVETEVGLEQLDGLLIGDVVGFGGVDGEECLDWGVGRGLRRGLLVEDGEEFAEHAGIVR
jgi:hypothetical protein